MNETEIATMMAKHSDELERAAERAEIAQERAVLAVRRELEEQYIMEHAEITKQIQAAESENSAEIRKLYAEIDNLHQQLATTQIAKTTSKINVKAREEEGHKP